jgi:hypothetical protein
MQIGLHPIVRRFAPACSGLGSHSHGLWSGRREPLYSCKLFFVRCLTTWLVCYTKLLLATEGKQMGGGETRKLLALTRLMRLGFFALMWGLAGGAMANEGAAFEPQLGLNFIRLAWPTRGARAAEALGDDFLFDDIDELGADIVRQFVRADVLWREVEPVDDGWDFSRSDPVIERLGRRAIVTLFSMQYASPMPPWASEDAPFEARLGPAAIDYVRTVVDRYADKVRYWEIGNEMDHWRIADVGARHHAGVRQPKHSPTGGFSPEQQGAFIAEVAAIVRARDPDAVIVLPGMAGLSEYVLDTWLPGVVKGAGEGAFDVVNYHYYGSWQGFEKARARLAKRLRQLRLLAKPVWCTETGSTASRSLSMRTDYPNGPPSQLADVFRRTLPAWAAGDKLVLWHTHVSSPDRVTNRWRSYGLRRSDGRRFPSWKGFYLLSHEVLPFAAVTPMANLKRGQHGYRVQRLDGHLRWVVWGEGSMAPPAGAANWTSVAPRPGAGHQWSKISGSLVLSEMPTLITDTEPSP